MNFLKSITTLQLGLIVLGAVLLIALLLWSNWNTRRKSPKQADPDDSMPLTLVTVTGDAEVEDDRLDPVWGAGEAPSRQHGRDDSGQPVSASGFEPSAIDGSREQWPRTEQAPLAAASASSSPPPAATSAPASSPPPAALPTPAPPMPPAERRAGALDPLIDVIAAIALDAPVSGDAVLQAVPPTRRVGSKPFAIEALHQESNAWQAPRGGQRYSALQTGVQMATRTGALNEIEFSEFVMKTQTFADALNGSPDFPEMLHEVGRARELDQFASDHDAQLGFKVLAHGAAWSPGYVRQHAARLGFMAGSIPGRMVLATSEPGLPPLLTLSFDTQAALAEDPTQAAIREVDLSLDVPQVARGARPYARMREVAAALAQNMDGVVTDERGQPLGPAAMDQIETEVEKLYDQLDGHELSAGSTLARRLFS